MNVYPYMYMEMQNIVQRIFLQATMEVNRHTKGMRHFRQLWLIGEPILWTTKHDHSIRYREFKLLSRR